MPDAGGSVFDSHAAALAAPRTAPRARRRILVTGASGMLGSDLTALLISAGYDVLARTKADLDITDSSRVSRTLSRAPAGRRRQLRRVHEGRRLRDGPARLPGQRRGGRPPRRRLRPRGRAAGPDLDRLRLRRGQARALPRGRPGRSALGLRALQAGRRGGGPAASREPRRPRVLALRALRLELRRGDLEAGRVRKARGSRSSIDQIGRPTSTTDLSEAILALLEAGASGIFHFANRGEVSWNEFAREILWLAGRTDVEVDPTTSEAFARPAKRPAYSVLDTGKYERLTGRPIRHFRDPLAEYLARRARPEA